MIIKNSISGQISFIILIVIICFYSLITNDTIHKNHWLVNLFYSIIILGLFTFLFIKVFDRSTKIQLETKFIKIKKIKISNTDIKKIEIYRTDSDDKIDVLSIHHTKGITDINLTGLQIDDTAFFLKLENLATDNNFTFANNL
jgi:hypothetical protein